MAVLNNLLYQALLAVAIRAAHGSIANPGRLAANFSSGAFAPYFPDSHPELASFPDIPYAQNPTGPLRFAPPVAATPVSEEAIHNTQLPAGCFQYVPPATRDTIGFTGQKAAEFQRGDYANTTEDCLRLSVFAPRFAVESALSESKSYNDSSLPVIVWIHGGGLAWGGVNVPYQLAPNWVQRSQAHIVVEVQYRLNILGLPNAAGLSSDPTAEDPNLNLALLDQRLAVEWVRDNIGAIGGDPSRITLWGQSAGGAVVDNFAYAWAEDPIVHGVIAGSGNALSLEYASVSPTNNSLFSLVASRLGCGDLGPAEELACMRALPATSFQTYLQAPLGTGGAGDDALVFGTVVDNVTVFSDYAARIAAGGAQFATQVPMLLGSTTNESGILAPYDFPGSATAAQLPADMQASALAYQLVLQCTTLHEVRLRAAAGATTFQYLYAGNFSDISPRPWLGAYHTSELPIVFGTYGTEGAATDFEARVSESMQDLYVAFAANGLRKTDWPSANATAETWELVEWGAGGNVEQVIMVDGLLDQCVQNGWVV